jgi:lysophospholipase L1-like esterase
VKLRKIALLGVVAALAAACSNAPSARSPTPPLGTPGSAPGPATLAPGPTMRYVAIGASDTVGVGASDPVRGSWPARIAARLPAGSAYLNLGVSGSLAIQAQREQLPGGLAQRPTLVTIWLAVNDLNAGIAPASYRESLAAIVDPLVARTEATIFVGNVPDLRPVPAYAGVDKLMLAAQIAAYNEVIAAVAAKDPRRVVVVDLNTGSAELVSNATVARDGFHPSDAGYQLIADRFVTAMRAKGVPLRAQP